MTRRVHELETRVEMLELGAAERQLTVMASAEKVAHALEERSRKRAKAATEPDPTPAPTNGPIVSPLLDQRRRLRGF